MKWRIELEYEVGSFTEPRRISFQAVYDGEPYHGYDTKREAHKGMRLRITKMEEAIDRKVIQCVPNPYDTYQELDERCSHCQLLRRLICIACPPEKEEE